MKKWIQSIKKVFKRILCISGCCYNIPENDLSIDIKYQKK